MSLSLSCRSCRTTSAPACDSACPSIERRLSFALDMARCYDQRHDEAGVLLYLLSAEQESPRAERRPGL
jgi:hypothetical protein